MVSDENCHSQQINRLTDGTSSVVKLTKSDAQVSSLPTVIILGSNSSPTTSSVRSSNKKSSVDNHSELPQLYSKTQKSAKEISIIQLRHRLCVREYFFARLALVSNLMSFLAILSIILMIIGNELTFDRVGNQDTKVSWFIKLIITITTAILLFLILYYNYLAMSLYSYRNLLEDWRVELTNSKILSIAMEVLICAIHPMPRSYPQSDPEKINLSSSNPHPLSYTAVDVGLGLPMFLRLYLLGRSTMIQSHLVRNITLRSLGYLNHVSIDFYFLIKTYLEQWPTRCLITFCTVVFFIGSWSLRACNYTNTTEHLSMSDSMWLFIITFTTVGYGDLYPSTYCGRGVAAIISLIGLLLSALLIAILTKKLLLIREEKYVHTFVLNTRLAKKRKTQAANVIKFAIKGWCLKQQGRSTSMQYFQTQRKLFKSIHCFQQVGKKQRSLVHSCVGFPELMTIQHRTNTQTEETVEQIAAIKTDVKKIEEKLNNMSCNMEILQNTLNILLDKLTK